MRDVRHRPDSGAFAGIDDAYVSTGCVLCVKGQRPCPVVTRFQVSNIAVLALSKKKIVKMTNFPFSFFRVFCCRVLAHSAHNTLPPLPPLAIGVVRDATLALFVLFCRTYECCPCPQAQIIINNLPDHRPIMSSGYQVSAPLSRFFGFAFCGFLHIHYIGEQPMP